MERVVWYEVQSLPRDDADSGWWATLPPPPLSHPLTGAETADWIVVGAGFTGLAAARRLAEHAPDARIALVEAERAGFGASGRNSGFIVDIGHYKPELGVAANRRIVRLQRAGCDLLRRLVDEHVIDCAWTERGRLHGAIEGRGMRCLDVLRRGLDAMQEPYVVLDRDAVAHATGMTAYRAAIHTPGTVMIQPAALTRGLAASLPPNVALYEDSPVLRIACGGVQRVECGCGSVTAPGLVLATNGYTPALGFLRERIFPLLTYASLTRPLDPDEGRTAGAGAEWGVVPEDRMGTTLRRTRDGRILVRNGVHWPSNGAGDQRALEQAQATHRRTFEHRFPGLRHVAFEHTWGGLLGMTRNGGHFFGPLAEGVFVAAGCNGIGIAQGTISGTLVADLAMGRESELLDEVRRVPRPAWIPGEPFIGVGVRVAAAYLQARARAEL